MKNIKNKKNLILSVVVIALVGIIYIYCSSIKINSKISYSGTNEIANIKISRFTDYDEFLKAKPSSIIIYNEHSEMKDNLDALILGEVDLNYDFYRKGAEYKLKCIRKNGDSFSVNLMLISGQEVSEGNTLNAPFIAYDFDNSINGALEKVIITMDGIEITNLKLNKL
ncbi:hypothetical protein KQI86_08800 [Clostridium sp. MSJ-11]|uniref:Lipoprotein n=1 Tax=Clostridium mobile TaxID=2841512 RepID=A0ABS6EGT7_9CLOT|nr:hypothetical protein [Clostridium mobile]MBU5484425.1 hypothetical protein [Clostridium mobile]